MKHLIALLILLIAALPASAQKVKVTSNPNVDVARYKTYAWAQPLPAGNPIVVQTIVARIDQEMLAKGLRRVEVDPELTIAFWTATQSDPHFSATAVSHPTAPWLSSAGSQGFLVTKGTLVVSLADAATRSSVWEATASDTLENGPTGNPAKDAKTIEKPIRKAVAKMFKQFPHPK